MQLCQRLRSKQHALHRAQTSLFGQGIPCCRSLSETASIPTRPDMIERAKKRKEFDVLIVGGGSTGSIAALDAAKRGLSVLCVEKEDFASATSSRSTKLLWGGSRYLVEALVSLFSLDLRLITSPVQTIKKFMEEFRMVLNCHRERTFMMRKQPHLTTWVPIAVPLDRWLIWPPPFHYPLASLGPLGLFPLFFKFYDALSGFQCPPSHIMSRRRALRKFPQLANKALKYCSVFYEGMHDDARTNLAVAQTAAREGALIVNYCEAVEFSRDASSERLSGAKLTDHLTGSTFDVRFKSVLFCGGPFTDEIRKKEDDNCAEAVTGSAGIHIVLPAYFAPTGLGLVDMSTSDGRFLFYLPWNGHVLVGTTDHKCQPSHRPKPPEEEILWLLHEASKYLSPELQLRRRDVLSAWSGIRPLAKDPHARNTAQTSRDHIVSHNPRSGSVFVTGGKWTTFREMAEDALDKLVEVTPELRKRKVEGHIQDCSTLESNFVGYTGYSENLAAQLVQGFDVPFDVANRLAKAYGGRAGEVLAIAAEQHPSEENLFERLINDYPIIKAEVVFAARHDWAVHVEDFLARRCRLLFLNKEAAVKALPTVVKLMSAELNWTQQAAHKEIERANRYFEHFGGPKPISMTK